MAQEQDNEQQPRQSASDQGALGNSFTGGMNKDLYDPVHQPNTYYNAINAAVNLPDGSVGAISTEPGNILAFSNSLTCIGSIYIAESQRALFFTNNTVSEIGIYTEADDSYQVLINDSATIAAGLPGMGFKTSHLITGTARQGYDCGYDIYWSDGRLNPNRTLNTASCPYSINSSTTPNPWFQDCVTVSACIECTNTNRVNINQLRLAPIYSVPCMTLAKSTASGILLNGNYQVAMAYTVNGFRVTDYVAVSNQQSLWSHLGEGGGLVLNISGAETVIFKEMEIIVISLINLQLQAKRLGIYDTVQSTVYIDNLNTELVTIPVADIPISTPSILSSDSVYEVSSYLLQNGPQERPDPNYQPIANKIRVWWTCQEYPEDYYHKGGYDGNPMNVGYMRGEVYAYYIRGVYNTGDKTASYSIPGLPGGTPPTIFIGGPSDGTGGTGIAYGRMGGYSSTEKYPNYQPEVWGPLCGEPIMHHKFPDQTFSPIVSHFWNYGSTTSPSTRIRIMGVFFDNITPFLDDKGAIITDIVSYEILRATRDGYESILAKGMINNMRQVVDNTGTAQVFSNYPYNDLGIDVFLTTNYANIQTGATGPGFNSPLPAYPGNFSENLWSFHSPETVFQHPYLGQGTLKVLMAMNGNSRGIFEEPYKHPLFKVLTDFDSILSDVVSALAVFINAINAISGGVTGMALTGTEEIPWTNPLGITSMPDGLIAGTSTISIIEYSALLIANGLLIAALIPVQFSIINQQMANVIKGLIPGRQFALQYNSAGFYNTPVPLKNIQSSSISDYQYILGQVQSFAGYVVNNIYRNDYVLLNLSQFISPYYGDAISGASSPGSRFNLTASNSFSPGNWYNSRIGSYYAAYTVPQLSQYGQVDSTKQVPISCALTMKCAPLCSVIGTSFTSPVLYGGDTYVCRYTEKNPMMFFNDWLVAAPEDIIYDYRNYINVPYPMFWINNDVNTNTLLGLAHTNRRLDGPMNTHLFFVDKGYFYLFCNGVRDFYVESTINVGYRDWIEPIQNYFYDPYGFTDVNQMFRSDIIKTPPFYKYDYSLSANRFWNQWFTWSKCLRRDYNPSLAYTCFNYYPKRINYSLPQTQELVKDDWRLFLPNNYVDFSSPVTAIRSISKTGAIFLIDDGAPYQFAGTETIASQSGTEYTVGTGLLFRQALQQTSNADHNLQYGSCQNKLAVINSPFGVTWVSQRAGKIFHYAPSKAYFNRGETMIDITSYGIKYWMSLYLPSQLLKQYPTYPLYDNPVAGIGVQLIYDSVTEIIYICKKDYTTKAGVALDSTGFYIMSGPKKIYITVGDSTYFNDCSWTISYSPREKRFISFHSWVPSLNIQAERHFLTIVGGQLWRHNQTTDKWCNYYGVQYPFEIEMPLNSGEIATIENVEVVLDAFEYKVNQVDKFNTYVDFFNEAQVFNEEQSTLPLYLNQQLWNNPYDRLNYPNIVAGGMNILFTKVENKFRFSQLRDFTADRGQFTLTTQQMRQTDPNGYSWQSVTGYFSYFKPPFQQKKIRHRASRLLLRKSDITTNSISVLNVRTNVVKSDR